MHDIITAAHTHGLRSGSGLYVGCGNGRNYLPLARAGLALTGLDISREALHQLAKRAPEHRDRLVHGDLTMLPPEQSFDLVIGIQVFQHGNRATVHAALRQAGNLHILVEAPDATMASSTIMWLDEVNKTAEFEPVGTYTGYRHRGLGRAMLRHGMHRVRAAGASHVTVACLGAPGRRAARAARAVLQRRVPGGLAGRATDEDCGLRTGGCPVTSG